MRKTKILVCGASNFLMANFIRYILYRSDKYETISVDNLDDIERDRKLIYFGKRNKLYLGDFSDGEFMKKLIYLERPDYIICGDLNGSHMLSVSEVLSSFEIPLLMIMVKPEESDELKYTLPVRDRLVREGNIALDLPNRFGMRQKPSDCVGAGDLAGYIRWFLNDKRTYFVHNVSVPWVYAEDVASLIWFIIEKNLRGNVRMPPLGHMSEKEMLQKILNLYKKDVTLIENDSGEDIIHIICKYEYEDIEGWKPDSESLGASLEKTIRWYDANRWALK